MRVVLDTNVVVSGLLWSGSPSRLLDAIRAARASAFTSRELLQELADVLSRARLSPRVAKHGSSAPALVQGYAMLASIVTAAEIGAVVTDDVADDAVIAAALAARADLVVSGDRHLLDLKHYHGIPFLDPAEALRRIEASSLAR